MPAALIPLFGVLFKLLIVRIIIATGLTFVSFIGYGIALDKFREYFVDAASSMPADIYNLLLIGGFGLGFNYLFGAFAFYVSMRALNKLTFVMPNVGG